MVVLRVRGNRIDSEARISADAFLPLASKRPWQVCGLLHSEEMKVTTKVAAVCVSQLWLAVRLTDETLAFGISFVMKRFWVIVRLGPLCFDIAWGDKPAWSG